MYRKSYRIPPVLRVRNLAQAALFECELKGQLSDGHWENATPYDHLMMWCDAEVKLADAENTVGRNFWAQRTRYAFDNKDLLDVIGLRMIGIVRIANKLGLDVAHQLAHYIDCDDGQLSRPTYQSDSADKVRKLMDQFADELEEAMADESYGRKQLRSDLRDLGNIVKMWSESPKITNLSGYTDAELFG